MRIRTFEFRFQGFIPQGIAKRVGLVLLQLRKLLIREQEQLLPWHSYQPKQIDFMSA